MTTLLVSSSDCEMLLHLRSHGTLSRMAENLGLDKSYLSKRLSKIAQEAAVLEKVSGKWSLNSKGIELINWYEDAVQNQKRVLDNHQGLSIGTTQLISERIITGLIPKIKAVTKTQTVRVLSQGMDLEEALLTNKINYALTCNVPMSPEIRFKKVFKSPFIVAIPYKWKQLPEETSKLFNDFSYVSHTGMNLRKILNIEDEVPDASVLYDHLSGVREAVIQGHGWSILPHYAIQNEIKNKLVKIFKILPQKEEFQLCWHPERVTKTMAAQLADLMMKENY